MGYNYFVIGAGMMGQAIAYDLLQDPATTHIQIIDKNSANLEHIHKQLDDPRITSTYSNAHDIAKIRSFMEQADVAIGAAGYRYNASLTKIAIDTKTHFCDLGGNNTIVAKEFLLDKKAKNAQIKIIPDCGIAPGAVSSIVAYGIAEHGMPVNVYIRVGGLPQHPQGSLQYMKVFSIEGLINEYKEYVEVLDNGKKALKKSLYGLESLVFADSRFPEGSLQLEAAYTSGGSSTLTKTFEEKITTLDYKTLRYPGHWTIMQALASCGFFSEKKLGTGRHAITPREFTEHMIEELISYEDEDMLIARVTLDYSDKSVQYDIIDFQDHKTGHTAMQRTTGYSAAIVAQMMAKNQITDTGVLYIEKSVPPKLFIEEWAKRGLFLKKKIIDHSPPT